MKKFLINNRGIFSLLSLTNIIFFTSYSLLKHNSNLLIYSLYITIIFELVGRIGSNFKIEELEKG